LSLLPPSHSSPLFPYTTLFRSLADGRRTVGDGDSGGFERGDFAVGGAFAAGDDRAGVAHSSARRCGAPGDEGHDGLLHVLFDERDRKSTRLNSSHQIISYAVFC